MSAAANEQLCNQLAAGRTCTGEHRVWIGNIDERVSEYRLLKLLRRCGEVTGFDNLLHRDGAMAGRPRGYAFASYSSREQAQKAVLQLDGLQLGEKQLRLRWAVDNERAPAAKSAPEPPPEIVHVASPTGEPRLDSTQQKIRVIEAALLRSEAAAAADSPGLLSSSSSSGRIHVHGVDVESLPRVRATVDTINCNHRRHTATAPATKTRATRCRPRPPYKPRFRR